MSIGSSENTTPIDFGYGPTSKMAAVAILGFKA